MIRIIYTFFVALFLAIFIGMGVSVFYPAPEQPTCMVTPAKEPPSEQETQACEASQRDFSDQSHQYSQNVSIIVLACAVVILVISLVFAGKLGIIADGLLLGGIFTLLYGVGRGLTTDNNSFRFLVATIGLGVTLVLGYVKFTRQLQPAPTTKKH